jgi:hypothetical protein
MPPAELQIMLRKKRPKLCYLCGKPDTDTKDHIPSRGIFPEKPSGQLLTVPAHEDCNRKFSEDDELFRNLVIAASSRASEGRKAWDEQVVTSWKKNPGAKRQLQKRMMVVWVKDLITGALMRHQVLAGDVSLFERQVDRWTRGLFYRRLREPMPPDLTVHFEKLDIPEISLPPLNEMMTKHGARPNWVHVEPNIFSYLYDVADEDNHTSIAIFVLFNTEVYMASTNVV